MWLRQNLQLISSHFQQYAYSNKNLSMFTEDFAALEYYERTTFTVKNTRVTSP